MTCKDYIAFHISFGINSKTELCFGTILVKLRWKVSIWLSVQVILQVGDFAPIAALAGCQNYTIKGYYTLSWFKKQPNNDQMIKYLSLTPHTLLPKSLFLSQIFQNLSE